MGRPGPAESAGTRGEVPPDRAHRPARGAEIPAHYPHYGPYPFAATFRPEVDDREQSRSKGANDHGNG